MDPLTNEQVTQLRDEAASHLALAEEVLGLRHDNQRLRHVVRQLLDADRDKTNEFGRRFAEDEGRRLAGEAFR